MVTETRAATFIRGLVKAVFIGCYMAFMWASIHHVATFFNNFEENSGNTIGSYLLAGAFDVTALVTTIGVMFFRKSMPAWVFWIVWSFIIAIAGYSFFINWEYASHYQNMTLIMQPTGETTPVYDASGVLHYVPVMQVNTSLLWVNPVLASGFTIFSLIYSVVAEFFGTKAPTIEELLAKKKYLEETEGVLEDIKKIEGKNRGPSLINRLKQSALEVKSAVKEVVHEPSPQADSGHDEGKQLVNDPLNSQEGESVNEELNTGVNPVVYSEDEIINEELNEDVNDSVHSDVYQSPRITDDLTKQRRKRSVNTEVNKAKPSGSSPTKQIHKLLRKDQTLGPTELAAKVGCTKGYASQIKSQFLTMLKEESAVS